MVPMHGRKADLALPELKHSTKAETDPGTDTFV